MASMHYLTVQDILWINYQVTQKVQEFDYAKLEEATFYQYGYGASQNLLSQAARFVEGFLKLAPIHAGNEATGFVGLVAFVRMNGHDLKINDTEAASWLKSIASGQTKAIDAIERLMIEQHDGHHGLVPNVQQICRGVLESYPQTISTLAPAAV